MIHSFEKRACKNRACRNKFTPTEKHPFAIACCIGCEFILSARHLEKVLAARAKAEAKQIAARRQAIKSKSDWLAEAQQAVNAWIRERDHDLPCISCGRHHTGQYHAGHYQNVGSHPALRFSAVNIHKQCAPCNNHLGGNKIEYRKALIKKESIDIVEWLEGFHEAAKYTIDELKAIRDEHRALTKKLVAEREMRSA